MKTSGFPIFFQKGANSPRKKIKGIRTEAGAEKKLAATEKCDAEHEKRNMPLRNMPITKRACKI